MTINGGISFWYATDHTPARPPRAPLTGHATADVVIVGGGYTGLWTAYYLKTAAPDLRVTVLEQKFCGYGASGRNGGWLYNGIAGRDRYAELHGHQAALRLQQAMNDTVTEVIGVAAKEDIDADIHRGGVLEVARTPPSSAASRPSTPPNSPSARATASSTTPPTPAPASTSRTPSAPAGPRTAPGSTPQARQGPGRRLRTPRRGHPRIHPVTEIAPRRAITPYGTVRAPYVLRCTEGFTAALKGQKRSWLPMNSSMIATAPLPPEVWSRIGWSDACTLGDMAHAYMYAQRTADDRIAIGGRGVPYRFGSRTDTDGTTQQSTIKALTQLLTSFFPILTGVEITHAWSGVLGVPATGAPRWPWTARRASAGPAATSARASRPPTSRPAPCATWSWGTPRT